MAPTDFERLYDEHAPAVFAFLLNLTRHEADEGAFREALSGALGDRPADQRAVVHLKLWEGLTFELTGVPLNTAARRYRHGLDHGQQANQPPNAQQQEADNHTVHYSKTRLLRVVRWNHSRFDIIAASPVHCVNDRTHTSSLAYRGP
jgi:hypothetical protein